MNLTLHAIAYIGASAIALTYAFHRILDNGPPWQGAAVFALAFFMGLDAYVWLRTTEVPENYPLFLHIIDWLAVFCAFGACVYLREPLEVRRSPRNLTLGLYLFAIYGLLCASYWTAIWVRHKSNPAYTQAWGRFRQVEPDGWLFHKITNYVANPEKASERPAVRTSITRENETDLERLVISEPQSMSAVKKKNDVPDEHLIGPIAFCAIILYGLCGLLAGGLACGNRRGWTRVLDFRGQGLWVVATCGLYLASFGYLLFLRPPLACFSFALGAPTVVLLLFWFASALNRDSLTCSTNHTPRSKADVAPPKLVTLSQPSTGTTQCNQPELIPTYPDPYARTTAEIVSFAIACFGFIAAISGVIVGSEKIAASGAIITLIATLVCSKLAQQSVS